MTEKQIKVGYAAPQGLMGRTEAERAELDANRRAVLAEKLRDKAASKAIERQKKGPPESTRIYKTPEINS